MKKYILKCNFLFLLLFAFSSLSAQKKGPFIEKWNASQEKAEQTVKEYQQKYPDIKHYKADYKSFYDSISGQKITLDMFIEVPKGKGPFPVVIFIHGGGFVGGDKSNFTHQSFAVAQKGIVGISIEYRLRGHGGTYAQFIEDAMDAIDYVRKHAVEYNIDFSRLALSGGSAGAYLSSYAAMKTPECICYVGYNGGYDVGAKESSRVPPGLSLKEISPILMIKSPPPATLLFHGKEDTTIDYKRSVSFADAIKSKGGTAEVMLYDGQKHSFFNKEPYLTQTTDTMLKHVIKILKP
ncbi:MAG: alpha/beta hydrolase [Paludibacter sp.]|nr:alpha/beta hydrolase [Paludibacter sp.]